MRLHKSSCINPDNEKYHYKVYKYIRENGGWKNWKYEIIDEVEVANKYEGCKYEKEYITKYDCLNKLNTQLTGLTKKECDETEEDYKRRMNIEYKKRNKEKLKEQSKEYRLKNYEIISQKHKEWREKNKKIINQRQNDKYHNNRDEIVEKRKEKICCDICGVFMRKDSLTRHKKNHL
jgi:hypothetical protein